MKQDDYSDKYISDEIRKKENLSRQEVADMIARALHCPHCNYTTDVL